MHWLMADRCIAISADAAQVVVGLRPFESADDIRAKLKKTKGVSGKLFDNMVDVIRVSFA